MVGSTIINLCWLLSTKQKGNLKINASHQTKISGEINWECWDSNPGQIVLWQRAAWAELELLPQPEQQGDLAAKPWKEDSSFTLRVYSNCSKEQSHVVVTLVTGGQGTVRDTWYLWCQSTESYTAVHAVWKQVCYTLSCAVASKLETCAVLLLYNFLWGSLSLLPTALVCESIESETSHSL